MKKVKELCNIHHFMYDSENGCPFCKKERLQRLSKKFCMDTKGSDVINVNDINKLKEKFNSK